MWSITGHRHTLGPIAQGYYGMIASIAYYPNQTTLTWQCQEKVTGFRNLGQSLLAFTFNCHHRARHKLKFTNRLDNHCPF